MMSGSRIKKFSKTWHRVFQCFDGNRSWVFDKSAPDASDRPRTYEGGDGDVLISDFSGLHGLRKGFCEFHEWNCSIGGSYAQSPSSMSYCFRIQPL